MSVGILTLEIEIPGSRSLKEKRSILAPLQSRLRKEFNISISETDLRNSWNRSILTIAAVQPPTIQVQSYLQSVITFIEREIHTIEIVDHSIYFI
ncbi:MAG TPA: DUF503 domain-containing protein [Bellilinea sp.]|nr:DUF503 domain-containing protein [Bellilinea sp.]